MTNFLLRNKRVLVLAGLFAVAMLFSSNALASDPAHVLRLKETGSCVDCDLSGAPLINMDLKKANLSGANLSGARLYKSDLSDADLTGANLVDAELRNANLKGAKGVIFFGAITDAGTTCPDGTAGPCK